MKYYSFFIGAVQSRKKAWIRFDLKLPAMSVKEAITLHSFHMQYQNKYHVNHTLKPFYFLEPSRELVFATYRMIYEYERSWPNRNLYCRHTYKKVNEYPVHRVLKWFKKSEQIAKEHPMLPNPVVLG